MGHHHKNFHFEYKNIILFGVIIIATVLLAILIILGNKRDQEDSVRLKQLNSEIEQEEHAEEKKTALKNANDSFYQKLSDGFDVNVLVVGDSIGAGSGTETNGKQWFSQLSSYLGTTYKSKIKLTNISMGGNASYAGYVRTRIVNDDVSYDLAIICYGQNDGLSGFSTNYESIIRAIEKKYPDCSIISILESSQRKYTEKMKTIQSITDHYKIPVVDTIAAFNNSGIKYSKLSSDGVHPNDAGQDIYFKAVKSVINKHVKSKTKKMSSVDPVNTGVKKFDNFVWYGIGESSKDENSGFERTDDTTFTLKATASGVMGIDYTYESGSNKAKVYVDGSIYTSPTVNFNHDFSQRRILVISDDCTVKNEIKVVFNSKEQADGFKGMCFSWE